jgi:hypothetical protein
MLLIHGQGMQSRTQLGGKWKCLPRIAAVFGAEELRVAGGGQQCARMVGIDLHDGSRSPEGTEGFPPSSHGIRGYDERQNL